MATTTIEDVALAADVSIKTVSRVINKEPNVSEKTQLKVEAAVLALNYRPNLSARGLATGRSNLLGLVYDNPSPAYIIDAQKGVLAACDAAGFNVLIHPCDYADKNLVQELIQLAQRSGLEGLVLTSPVSEQASLVAALTQAGVPTVLVTAKNSVNHNSMVSSNDYLCALEMTRYIIQQGHQRIGFIKGHPNHVSSEQRFEGFKHALAEAQLSLNPNWVVAGDYSFESGELATNTLLNQDQLPTAVFASNDYMAAGLVRTAAMRGVKVPQDLSVTGFDDAPVASQIWPPLTTVKQPIQAMAALAAQTLISHLRKTAQPPQQEAIKPTMVIRQSVAVIDQVLPKL